MTTLYHQVWIDAPVANVYPAIATAEGLGHWWAPHTSTETAAGLVLAHNPGEAHGEVRMKALATEFLGSATSPGARPAHAQAVVRSR